MKKNSFIKNYKEFSGVEENFSSAKVLYEIGGQLSSLNGISKNIKGVGRFNVRGGENARPIPVDIIVAVFEEMKDCLEERGKPYTEDVDLLFSCVMKNKQKISYLSFGWLDGIFTNCGALDLGFGGAYFSIYKKDCDATVLQALKELGYDIKKPYKTDGTYVKYHKEG